MILRILLFLLAYIIPVLIIVQGRKMSRRESEHPLAAQLWKLTGYLLVPATVIVSALSLTRPVNTQLILTACVVLLQVILLIFLMKSASRLSEK